MSTFYLGTHRPIWLSRADVPLFISAVTLYEYRSTGDKWPTRKADTFGCGIWALDSGAFTALSGANTANHPWHLPADDFGGMVYRFAEEIGVPPQFAAPQDWPCEPGVLARTGLTIAAHQEMTTDSFLYLQEQFDGVNWAPVLQGWAPADYIAHMRAYEAAGVELDRYRPVGLGSVCRRGSVKDIVAVVQAVQSYARAAYGRPLRLHGFGLKTIALRSVGHIIDSADSQAWSMQARLKKIRLDGCTHEGNCGNCMTWALQWRDRVLDAWRQPHQQDLGVELVAA